jgi:cytochrome P450
MRKLVSRAFTPRAITRMEPIAHEIITKYLDAVQGAGSFDAVVDFAAPFPVEVISAILGVPEADRQQIRHWTDEMLVRRPNDPAMTAEGMHSALEQILYFLALVQDKRAHAGDDMISQLVEAEVESEDGTRQKLTDEEIAGFAALLAAAGSETVTKLVGSAIVLFHRNPGEWQKVLSDPGKVPNAVEETLRYWAPSQYQGRFSHLDSEWHGVTIPAGQPVFLVTGAANRDEREYADPDVFDVDREIGLSIGLGHGIHSCLGAALARLESRMAVLEFAKRWPRFAVDEAACRRVNMSNVAGYSSVPVTVGA